jgi:DNA-binding MarR family transcriptional regulator
MVHPTSITNTIDRLERQGLVRRVPHAVDRRLTLASITPKGRRLAERATRALGQLRFGTEPLKDPDARALVEFLRSMRESVGDFDSGNRMRPAKS